MLASKYLKSLRAIQLSKSNSVESGQVTQLKQIVIKVKAEQSFDAVNNLVLLNSLVGKYPASKLINTKKGVVLPEVVLSKTEMNTFVSEVLPELLARTIDKITAISFGSSTNKLTFSFKATDAINTSLRKIWKLFETEVGNYEFELTFVTNSSHSAQNELLLRGMQLPVVIV